MAEQATLARPYANAVFDLARTDNSLDAWSQVLALLAGVSAEPPVRRLLDAPDRPAEVKAAKLIELLGDALNDRARNLVRLLARNKRLDLLAEIHEQFEVRKAEAEKMLDVEVVSAFELTAEQSARLRDVLQRRFAKEINLTGRVDAAVLGGAIIRAGDTVIDGSVRGRLDKLAEALQRK
jgi:F-type H+-transporting ATPase subunit delta